MFIMVNGPALPGDIAPFTAQDYVQIILGKVIEHPVAEV
jgi:hypothetical protein